MVKHPQPATEKPLPVCLDKGDDHPTGHDAVETSQNAPHIQRIGEETLYFYCQTTDPARQWVVGRSPARLSSYGSAFIHAFKKRLGVERSLGKVVTVLCPVVMALWDTETPTGWFIDVLE